MVSEWLLAVPWIIQPVDYCGESRQPIGIPHFFTPPSSNFYDPALRHIKQRESATGLRSEQTHVCGSFALKVCHHHRHRRWMPTLLSSQCPSHINLSRFYCQLRKRRSPSSGPTIYTQGLDISVRRKMQHKIKSEEWFCTNKIYIEHDHVLCSVSDNIFD